MTTRTETNRNMLTSGFTMTHESVLFSALITSMAAEPTHKRNSTIGGVSGRRGRFEDRSELEPPDDVVATSGQASSGDEPQPPQSLMAKVELRGKSDGINKNAGLCWHCELQPGYVAHGRATFWLPTTARFTKIVASHNQIRETGPVI